MATFALVHGGAHGSWCWEMVVPELQRRGHRCVTPDLPFEDETAGAGEWADAVVNALEEAGADDRTVLVGHSMSGLCLPVVASRGGVDRMVFLGALVPVPGVAFADYLRDHPDAVVFDNTPEDRSSPVGVSWEAARRGFYQDCDETVARRAYERLRPTPLRIHSEPCPIDTWPDVPSTYILMRDDRAVGQAWSRRVALDRIHADLIEIDGGHSPFYARPVELVDLFETLV